MDNTHTLPQPPRLLIISHDVVGTHMAGTGIRYWELACVLATQQSVMLIAPHPIDCNDMASRDLPNTLQCGYYTWGDWHTIAQWLDTCDVVLANGFVREQHPQLATIAQPLALDIYDPTLLENIELFRHADAAERQAHHEHDQRLLQQQIAAGDFFVCATERQRDVYIGVCMAQGRITPDIVDRDDTLRLLIDVVSSGLLATPPQPHRHALRDGSLKGMPVIADDDPIILWAGGLWDWLDPLTAIEAMPIVLQHMPTARLVFLAGQHPGNAHPMHMSTRAKQRADAVGLTGSAICFVDEWIAYEERVNVLCDATLALSLHRNHLETRYAAIRSRIFDHWWAGLPTIISAGDPAAEVIHHAGAGIVVPTQSPTEVANTIVALLTDAALYQQQQTAARHVAQHYTWHTVATPLARFCLAPYHTRPTQTPMPSEVPSHQEHNHITNHATDENDVVAVEKTTDSNTETTNEQTVWDKHQHVLAQCRNAAMQVQEETWRLHEHPIAAGKLQPMRQLLIEQVVRPYVAPLIEQQQACNAAVLRSLYAINEIADHRYRVLEHHYLLLDSLIKQQTHNLNETNKTMVKGLEQAVHDAQRYAELYADNIREGMQEYIQRIEQHSHELGLRSLDMQGRIEKIKDNDRMTRHVLYDMTEHLASLAEADIQLQALLHGMTSPPPKTYPTQSVNQDTAHDTTTESEDNHS